MSNVWVWSKTLEHRHPMNTEKDWLQTHTQQNLSHFYKTMHATSKKSNSSFRLSSFPMRAYTLKRIWFIARGFPLCFSLCVYVYVGYWGSLNLVDDTTKNKQMSVYSVFFKHFCPVFLHNILSRFYIYLFHFEWAKIK